MWRDRRGIDIGPLAFEEWGKLPVLLAAGDPIVLQAEMEPDQVSSASDVDTIALDEGEPDWRYSYAAFRPTEVDEEGRVVAFETWEIACGPMADEASGDGPAPDEDEALESGYVTSDPFPGLTVVGNHCTAESVDALRRAAAPSAAISTHRTMTWVRAGWR